MSSLRFDHQILDYGHKKHGTCWYNDLGHSNHIPHGLWKPEKVFHRTVYFTVVVPYEFTCNNPEQKINQIHPNTITKNMSWKSQVFKSEDPWNHMAPGLHMEVLEGTKNVWDVQHVVVKNGSGQENMLQDATTPHLMDSTKLKKLFSCFCHPWNPVSDRNFNKQTIYPIHS